MEGNKIPEIRLVLTDDGTSTLYNAELDEHYHSLFGSYRESMHVYIEAGLRNMDLSEITVFEIGFGSGLNAFLTMMETMNTGRKVNYFTIEKYPLPREIYENFHLPPDFIHYKDIFLTLHTAPWNRQVDINRNFSLKKILGDWTEYIPDFHPHLVYYDAFSYDKQPQMWSKERFEVLYRLMPWNGVIVTYAAKGAIKQNMRAAGFEVKRLSGPAGKRHMVRAIKKQGL